MKRTRSMNLHRDPDNGWIAGVCAGLATYFDVDRKIVRIIMVLGVIFILPAWPVLIAYVVAACLLPKKNRAAASAANMTYDDPLEDELNEPGFTPNLNDVEDDFDHLERKLRGLEAYLSSKDLELDRAFRNLERGQSRA